METKDTRTKILLQSLELFSKKGFTNVSIDEIGKACSIKGPAIYKHFKGKDDLLKSLYEYVEVAYKKHISKEEIVSRLPNTKEEFFNASYKNIKFTVNDPLIRKMRMISMLEQYRNEKFASISSFYQFDNVYSIYTLVFTKLIELHRVKDIDPKILALEYVPPVSVLIQVIDREPNRMDEGMELIKTHINEFIAKYWIGE